MFNQYIVKLLTSLNKYSVYLGRRPSRVRGPAIIFFPLLSHLLCCGLAGMVTIKGASSPPDIDGGEGLAALLKKIRERDIAAVLAGSRPLEEYLGGELCLEEMEQSVHSWKTDNNFRRFFFDPSLISALTELVKEMRGFLTREEKTLEEKATFFSTARLETINGRLIKLRDIAWAAERDILGNVEKILKLANASDPGEISPASLLKYKKINLLFNCLDRLEVRGRDSAGIQLSWTLDPTASGQIEETLADPALQKEFSERKQAGDLVNGSINLATLPRPLSGDGSGATLSLTYKTSSVIGELGQNTANLRKAVLEDKVFRALNKCETVFDTAFIHTRWASVGSITEENCHPVNNFTVPTGSSRAAGDTGEYYPAYGTGAWTISVALNGDIDNYQQLRNGLEKETTVIAPEVTTDTKIIPLIIQKYLRHGDQLATAFRRAVNDFEGSHAIAMVSNVEPGKVFLALRGSGQSLYLGISPDQYIFSSEIYGLVEVTPFFLKMDGEVSPLLDVHGSSGQILILDQDSPGGLEGVSGSFYDGTPLRFKAEQIRKAEITTRDIDRGDYPHYFLKEITESALSVQKTLRGKYLINSEESGKTVVFNLGEDIVPTELKEALLQGQIARVSIIGHGTAAVAGEAIACAMARYLEGSPIKIEAKVASELSGFCLADNFTDTLIIAITQSGTTTDTNRAVAMARERGAMVVAIVNRRQSDITTKAQGVFYTSDGRDIEMSVASTKAFYSQIVAGHVLALYLAQLLKTQTDDFIAEELAVLEQAPALMTRVIEKKQQQIQQAVETIAGQKKYWAVVGSGPNKAAADEIRIKLSELCYRTISSDVVENKKHIDLSSEPLIIVCAAGTPETVLGDIIKDVAIFKAHKAGVIVFTDEGESRFNGIADAVIELPRVPLPLPVILNTVAGHLWGYFAARAIDEEALFFRIFRSRLSAAVAEQAKNNYSLYEKIADRQLRRVIREFYRDFHQRRQQGGFSLSQVKTIADLVLLLKYAGGKLPLDDFWYEFPGAAGSASPIELLDITLGQAIDELTRPIDAIRHQAKTVTVGTSRKEPPLQGIIFDLLKKLTFSVQTMTTKNILTLTALQPAIGSIKGYTLYEIGNLDAEGNPSDNSTIVITKRGGIALAMKSRVESSAALMGTKRTIVSTGHVYVGYGKADRTSLVVVPLLEEQTIKNLLLVHVGFNEALNLRGKKDVLGHRYNDIRNLINEYNLVWDDRCLEQLPLTLLLTEPVEVIADRIRRKLLKEEGKEL